MTINTLIPGCPDQVMADGPVVMDERDLIRADAPSVASRSATGRRSLLATPLGLALVIPLLVLIAGGGAGWLAWRAARDVVRVQGSHLLVELGQAKRNDVQLVMESGGAMLDAMHLGLAAMPDLRDEATTIRVLLPILRGRSGMTVHVTYPDGRWYALARDSQDRRLICSRRQTDGSQRLMFVPIDSDGRPKGPEQEYEANFDPRTRPYWLTAQRTGRRAWTEPYIFRNSKVPGISLCEPLLNAEGHIALVMTVNFDLGRLVNGVSGSSEDAAADTVIFTADHTVLAAPPSWELPSGRMITAADVTAPEAVGCFATIAAKGLPTVGGLPVGGPFHAPDGSEWGVAVTTLSLPDGPTWYLGEVANRSFMLGRSDEVAAHSFPIAVGVLIVAVGAGLWFARHLAHARQDVIRQRDRAYEAEAKVRELGSYRLTRCLGQGGMGEVWLAQHRLLARPAAVKLISPNYLGRSEEERSVARLRFEREARITASLRSRATIDLYDYGVAEDGTWFYVMELLDGLELRQLVAIYGPQPLGRIVHILEQACASLAEAHDRGLVHRDIKPDNLHLCRLADEVDIVKVLDFGVVAERTKCSGRLTEVGYVQGTPVTMAPEQARGAHIDGRVDIYALGCVAYFLATGEDVFSGDSYDLINQHVRSVPVAPSLRANHPLPSDFDALVLNCLAKDRDQRPRDARMLASALRRLVIPDDQTWDAERAQAWWQDHIPLLLRETTEEQVVRPDVTTETRRDSA